METFRLAEGLAGVNVGDVDTEPALAVQAVSSAVSRIAVGSAAFRKVNALSGPRRGLPALRLPALTLWRPLARMGLLEVQEGLFRNQTRDG